MPALKMKIKSMANCVSEGNFHDRESGDICRRKCCVVSEFLDGHRESSEICKRKRCMVSESYETLDVELKKICHNGHCEVDIVKETMLDDSTYVETNNRDDAAIQLPQSPFEDTSSTEIKDSSTVRCPSNVDVASSVGSFDTDGNSGSSNNSADSSIMSSSLDQPAFHSRGSTNEFLTNAENSWFQLVAQQTKSSCYTVHSSASLDSDETEFFDPHSFIRNILDLSDLETNSLPALLPKEPCERKRITLVLDLDETLIHSTTQPCDDADFSFKIFFNMEEHTVYVRQRPFLKAFLERVSEMFDVVIFTASESIYAGQLLDMLDPERKFFTRRVYRDSCVIINGNYTKDLTILGVDLARVAIVDNCPQVFQLQVSNGIPIQSWFDDPSDRALMSLLPFLDTLAEADDVRPIIAKKFGVKE